MARSLLFLVMHSFSLEEARHTCNGTLDWLS